MKNIIFIVLFLCCTTGIILNAQLTITPNASANGVCPGVSRTFTVNGIPSGCSGYTLALQTGNTTFSTSGNTFTIQPNNFPQNIVVSFSNNNNAECPANQTFTIPVLSVAGQIPTVSGFPGQLVRGKPHTINLTASHFYSFRGTQDPLEVASYTWSISSGGTGWSISTSNGSNSNGTTIQRKFATITTDNCSAATISVFSTDHCGNTSLTATIPISRFTEQPSLAGVPTSVVCCRTQSFNLSAAQATSGLSGYSYIWDFGSWSGTSMGSNATVTSNGTTGTTISVAASACGVASSPSSSQVNIVPIDPATTISGNNILCNNEQANYQISPALENCVSTTWSVSPSNAVTPSQGTGSNATFSTNPNFNGTISITYDFDTPCGNSTKSTTVHVGKPVIDSINVPPCFNRYSYYTLKVNAKGATNIRWTVPQCDKPRPLDPLAYNRECWHVVDRNLGSSPYVRIYSGESDGHISVWVSNECGEVSRAIPIVWCNPREDGPGPILPRIVNPNPTLDIPAVLGEIENNEIIRRTVSTYNDDIDVKAIYQENIIKVYPNPVGSQFILSIERTGMESEMSVKISKVNLYDMTGRYLDSYMQESDEYIIPMNNKSSGKYYIQVEFSNGKKQVIPILKVE